MARDYKKEYANYHSRPDQIKRRAARNAARRAMRGRKELTDEKDVHHKDNNPMNNDKSNLSIVTQHYNRREPRLRVEDLRKWFGKGKKGDWVRVGTDGEIKGDCAREPGEGKPKCMPRSKAHSMDKKDRASSARRKRRADPSVDRPGTGNKPIMVKTDKKESAEMNEQFVVKYAKNKRGPIYQTKFSTQGEAEKFLAQKRKEGMNGIVSKAGKPVSMQKMKDMQKESAEQLDELSPDTIDSYLRKRSMSKDRSQRTYQQKARDARKAGDEGESEKNRAKAKKIGQGINRAVARYHSQRRGDEYLSHKSVKRVPQAYKDRAKHGPIPKDRKWAAVGESYIEEKNVPTNPALWAKMKAQAKAKFDVYPSAYANGWAAKKYKAAGGGWKTTKESTEMKSFWDIREGSCGTMNAQTKKDEKPPFEPNRKVGVKKDRFGNVVKDKNRAKHLAKLAMRGEDK